MGKEELAKEKIPRSQATEHNIALLQKEEELFSI